MSKTTDFSCRILKMRLPGSPSICGSPAATSAISHTDNWQYPTSMRRCTALLQFLQFQWPFSTCTWVSQYQNVSILDFVRAKADGGGGDNWSYKMCIDPVKSSPTTNQPPAFYRPDILPVAKPTASKHWRECSLLQWYMQFHTLKHYQGTIRKPWTRIISHAGSCFFGNDSKVGWLV